MAAIIAQLSIANRRRKKRQRETKWIESDKCVYSLPPFDPCFQPMKHNKYLKNKVEFERRQFIAQKAKGTKVFNIFRSFRFTYLSISKCISEFNKCLIIISCCA